jgi:cell division protein YceG involved in septum cleavage
MSYQQKTERNDNNAIETINQNIQKFNQGNCQGILIPETNTATTQNNESEMMKEITKLKLLLSDQAAAQVSKQIPDTTDVKMSEDMDDSKPFFRAGKTPANKKRIM